MSTRGFLGCQWPIRRKHHITWTSPPPRCKTKAVKVQQQDFEVGKKAVEVHGPVDRHHANDADALQQADKHPKGACCSEEHRSLRRDLRCHGVVGNGEEEENAHNADGLGRKCFLRVSTPEEDVTNTINTLRPAHHLDGGTHG